nr:MAG TPA: hypothetical protein [Caudoviricetes sp.]
MYMVTMDKACLFFVLIAFSLWASLINGIYYYYLSLFILYV